MLPEIPYDINSVLRKIEERRKSGKKFSIIVVAEGAKPIGGELSVARVVEGSFEPLRLGGAGENSYVKLKIGQELNRGVQY